MKKPNLHDTVTIHEPAFNRVRTGKVTQLLSMQFIIHEPHNSTPIFCLFSGDWSIDKRARPKLKKSRLGH